jgi:hypothetical protein
MEKRTTLAVKRPWPTNIVPPCGVAFVRTRLLRAKLYYMAFVTVNR